MRMNRSSREPHRMEEGKRPVTVTLHEIVVDRDHMNLIALDHREAEHNSARGDEQTTAQITGRAALSDSS